MTRPAPAASSAAVCPPRPAVPSTYTPSGRGARMATTSSTSTGTWRASDSVLRECSGVVIGERLTLELADEPVVVPDLEVLRLPEDVDLARHAGGIAQARR